MAEARAKTPEEMQQQRRIIQVLIAMFYVLGFVLAMAFKDPCPHDGGLTPCHPTINDRLPDSLTLSGLSFTAAMLILAYECRWYLRVAMTAALGSCELVVAVLIVHDDMSTVLAVANALAGCALIGCAVGIQRGSRVAWAYATVICYVLAVVFFFGSSRVRDATGWPLSLAVLPSFMGFLPTALALGFAPPGGTPYAPFAKAPLSAKAR
jgi:hypothetical protein